MQNRRVIANASWIIISKMAQAFLGIIISMLTARYLGPANFGVINYATSLVAFVTPLMKLGLDAILVREIINYPHEEGETLGTAIVLNLSSCLLCMIGTVTFCTMVNPGERTTILVCALYSLILPAQAVEMIMYWYQAKLLSKYTSIVSLGAYTLISVYKILLLILDKSVFWFAVSNALDYLLIGIVLHILYGKLGAYKLRFSWMKVKRLLTQSKFYIVSALMVTVFAQTDRIMLKIMIDETAVGYYSASVACAGMASFVFAAIIDSMRPEILEVKKKSREMYEHRIKQLYAIIVSLSIWQSILITFFAEQGIWLLYGPQFKPAVGCLRIVVWYTTFSYYGGAKDVWILAEGRQRYLVWLNAAGAIANVVLNAVMIPLWGANGAAAASLLTQFFTNVVMGFVLAPLRHNNMLLLQSLHPRYIVEIFGAMKNLWRGLRKVSNR